MASHHPPKAGSRVASENVAAIKARERLAERKRTAIQRLSDGVIDVAVSGLSFAVHAIWFGSWIAINTGMVGGIAPFDPFPFSFLNMLMALEAIFLALFVLESQSRLMKQSEQRSNLDLQINLLAEREMTAALQLLNDIAVHLKVKTSVSSEQLEDLVKETDVHRLAEEVER